MDRSRRTSATARRRTPGGSTSPVPLLPDAGAVSPGITPPVSLSMTASAARSPPNTAQNTTQNTSQNTAQGIQTRRGSKSLHPSFSFSTPASANRGQGIKRRCRTMDGSGLPNNSLEQNSPRKGGHTLRKTPRVDYTFEHVDDQVVVPNSTSSRAKRRKLDHAFESEDSYASGVKTRGASLGSDTAAGLRRSSASEAMALGPEPRDDEDVKDTIEVGVSYSDMEDSGVRRGSNASSSSADHPYNGSWISAPAASHLPQLYSNLDTFTADAARVLDSTCQQNTWEDSQEENIDPQLRASPPASMQPTTVDIAEPAEVASPANAETYTGQTVDQTRIDSSLPEEQTADAQLATAATTGPHVDASAVSTAKPAVAPGVSADGVATVVTNGILLPNSPAIEEEGEVEEEEEGGEEVEEDSRVRELSISASEEIQRQLNATEAAADVPEPSDTIKTDAPGVSPDVGESFSSTSDAVPDEMDTPRTTQSSSLHVPTEDSAENVAEDAAKVMDLTASAADSVEMVDTKHSAARSAQPTTIPFISVDQVDSVEADAAGSPKEEENQEDRKETPNEDEQDPVVEKTEISPINSLVQNGESKVLEEHDTIAREYGDDLETSRSPQPTPEGRWSYLTPYLDGEFVTYPEKMARFDDDAGLDETAPEDKDGNEVESMVEDNDDVADPAGIDTQTPALNTPLRGSPVQDLVDPALENSPAQAGDDADDGELIETQEAPEQRRYYRYRKLRDADEFVTAIENYEGMSTEELVGALHAVAVSLDQWKKEWKYLGTVVDDHENAVRRRAADAKYEARTKDITLPGVNHEEPDFAVKGYKAKERELMSETRYLQSQDRIMSATYGFEYDPHPSKIGRQNPETQQAGIMTRGRSLRNQPKQTVKASEADEVTGKRQRRPVQLFDPASQDSVSRNSTPVPTRGRRRKQPNNGEGPQVQFASSFNGGEQSDAEGSAPKARKRRGPRASNAALEDDVTPRSSGAMENEETARSGRRRTARQAVRYDDAYSEFVDNDAQPETKQGHHHSKPHHHRKRHMLTLKIPRSKNTNEPSSAITDNGESRPSSSSSDTTAGTAESSYSFRPNRQKRFRDSPDEAEEVAQAPARKRGKRAVPNSSQEGAGGAESSFAVDQHVLDTAPLARKFQKIKVVRPAQDIRHETPFSAAGADGDDKPKDYKSMTKSEKMSASMKSRWANGNMAGAVEKRKATLAAKKAAQVAADAKDGGGGGTPAPKPNKPKHSKKEVQAAEKHPAGGYVPAIPGMGYPFSAN
ncbi:hypothetical protein E4U13_001973 [Claviceps humidiphila]|uniref:Uncharacterized protein n=1 Tax=Claviceps humidiphila TaxID=1294629 RepID=A0A9P7TQU2_9HYPO|nr:hypothetical protein E4U13_001973 [Claviceps humidiphila]